MIPIYIPYIDKYKKSANDAINTIGLVIMVFMLRIQKIY